MAENIGQAGLAEVEPCQNTNAKTKLVENVTGSLIIKGRQHLDPLLLRKADYSHACGDGGYTFAQSSVVLTINFKTWSATHYHSSPRTPDSVKFPDSERTVFNYILNSILISF